MRLASTPTFQARLIKGPGGPFDVEHTIGLMRCMVRESKILPSIINQAVSIIHGMPAKDEFYEVSALHDFVLNHVRYVRDVNGIETLSTPVMTLQRLVGDCDDKATLLATLLEAVGYPTRFVMGDYGAGFEHVYLQAFIDGEWMSLDPTEHRPIGWEPPGAVRYWHEHV